MKSVIITAIVAIAILVNHLIIDEKNKKKLRCALIIDVILVIAHSLFINL